MNLTHGKRIAFRPSLMDATLEQRTVLSSGGTAAAIAATPPPAPAPVGPAIVHRAVLSHLDSQLRRELKTTSSDLRKVLKAEIRNTYADRSSPVASRQANLHAFVAGAVDATALVISSEASVIIGSGSTLVPTIQNTLVGSSPSSLASQLNAALQSPQNMASPLTLQSTVATAVQSAQARLFANARRVLLGGRSGL